MILCVSILLYLGPSHFHVDFSISIPILASSCQLEKKKTNLHFRLHWICIQACSTFIMLFNYRLYLVSKHFYHSLNKILYALKVVTRYLPYSQSLTTTNLLSISIDITVLTISYKWIHALCDFFILRINPIYLWFIIF